MTDDKLYFIKVTNTQSNSLVGKLISEFISTPIPDWDTLMVNLYNKINETQTTGYNTYKDLNPLLEVYEINKHRQAVKENYHKAFTQFWVSGQNLCIETGRWNRHRQGRLLPKETVWLWPRTYSVKRSSTAHSPRVSETTTNSLTWEKFFQKNTVLGSRVK